MSRKSWGRGCGEGREQRSTALSVVGQTDGKGAARGRREEGKEEWREVEMGREHEMGAR